MSDYVSLLKDRKTLKIELEQTKRALKKSEEHVGDLNREIEHLKQHQDDLEHDVGELNKCLVSRDSGDYVSGLKRQIRSLKEHNMTLERKIEIETVNTKDVLASKDAKVMALQREVTDLKFPGKAVVRSMLGLAKGNVEDSVNSEEHPSLKLGSSHEDDGDAEKCSSNKESSRAGRPLLPKGAALWNAFMSPFGQKRTVSTDLEDTQLPADLSNSSSSGSSVASEGSLAMTTEITTAEDDTPSMCNQGQELITSVVATNSSNEGKVDLSLVEHDDLDDTEKNEIDVEAPGDDVVASDPCSTADP